MHKLVELDSCEFQEHEGMKTIKQVL